ncbi:hypothetical protein [uncultured Treponema sp.]|uniref:hypothetical protein n=1 Tax=uncultured Treponema sp. TaxID=162155 RepID=UPI0025E0C3FF|nr:hypothetical protein [uncultured Treponema sp.]
MSARTCSRGREQQRAICSVSAAHDRHLSGGNCRSAVEWGRLGRQPGAERTAEGY